MNIQSLSIVIPTRGCINNCKFCVSKMHDSKQNYESFLNIFGLEQRLNYAKLHNIDTCIITGTGEPLQNKEYLKILANLKKKYPLKIQVQNNKDHY